LILFGALILSPCAARAGPPYLTDDPEPVEFRHFEIYLASMARHVAGATSGTGPHLEINYGVVPDVQLHAIAPVAWVRDGAGTRVGYGDTELGLKLRFVHETASVPQIGIFPLVEVPTGNAARGLGNGQVQVFLPLWVQKSVGNWTTYGGGGVWLSPGSAHRVWGFAGWQAQYQFGRASLGAEVYWTSPADAGAGHEVGFNVGTVIDATEHHHVLASVGRDLLGPVVVQGYLAYQLTFGVGKDAPTP
jgi:hypothetical protein